MPDNTVDTPQNGAQAPEPAENIVDLEIERELQDSYLTYAMSTIMDRALPDVRDGLKPSQRRILVAMNDLNLGPRSKHRKCAKICGDVSGNYHPHGEGVIYPTLVRYGQGWVMRVPLIDKQGNFGSIDGDPPAAMRYTEARMAGAAADMLEDLKLDTVDFKPNYDETRNEPVVLPSKFPNLLVNGSTGIAVGMASSIPPHNLTEVCNAIEAVIDDPALTLDQLMAIIPGPDFPTGGIICGTAGVRKAYGTGRGRLTLRGRMHTEETAKGRQQLVIDEIPYHLVQNTVIDKIIDAVKSEKIKDITNVRNESGRRSRTRIVIELKRAADPDVVENQLYQYTPLQSTISIINIALLHRQPRTLSLRQMIDCYIDHRIEVIMRRTSHLLKEARKKAHVLEGLIYAVCDIDEVIALIRASRTREEAIQALMVRPFRIANDHPYSASLPERLLAAAQTENGVALSRTQAEAIGRLQLIQLVGLEIEKLVNDYRELVTQIEDYESIIESKQRKLDIIREDVREIRQKYGTERLTEIGHAVTDLDLDDLIMEEEVVVTISHEGYAKRVPVDTYREQRRGGRGIKGSESKQEDFTEHLFVSSTHDDLLCFTDTGRVFKLKVYAIPAMSRTSKGRAIVNLLDLRPGEKVRAFLTVRDFEKGEDFITFATTRGIVKRTALKDYRNVHRAGIIAVTLKDDDHLVGVLHTSGEDDLLLATRKGMAIRFNEKDVRVMGRNAAGVKGIALGTGDEVVGLVLADSTRDLLTVTENGYGKRTDMEEYLVQSEQGLRTQSRGGKGRIDIKTTKRNGDVVAVIGVHESDGVIAMSESGMVVRMPAGSISRIGRATQGVRVVNLKKEDRLISVARILESDLNGNGNGNGEEQA
ncbi:MAG: DNA gyrase subunit A [Planctomycetes bacterium]|nr:DNA gyrase subunit A [Planctomycetota bacterium]NOG53905.1 DNA gyrase subunit A [Planctomycetota bacterium]